MSLTCHCKLIATYRVCHTDPSSLAKIDDPRCFSIHLNRETPWIVALGYRDVLI